MKITQRIAILVMALIGLVYSSSASAQTNVAIVDIGVLFEKHGTFQQQLQLLRQEADELQKSVTANRQKLQQDAEAISLTFSPDQPEYKKREKEIALKAAQLDIDARDKMQELMTREAHIHYDTYNEVNRYVDDFCRQREVQLVLRYTGGEMNPADPDSIMQQINSAVVFHRAEKDITNQVVQLMLSAKSGVGGN